MACDRNEESEASESAIVLLMFMLCVLSLLLVLSLAPCSGLRVNDMTLQSSGGVSPMVLRKVWTEVLRQLSLTLVDSYAKAKKCTTEGRGLMTLDLSALRSGLEKLSGLKPLPYWDHVLSYVNAFYLPESELLAWVASHPHYNLGALQSVAECGCGAAKAKKDRMALLGLVATAHAEAVARTLQDRAAQKLKHQRAQSGVGVSLAPEGGNAPAAATAASSGSDATSTASTVAASASASASGAGSSSRLPSAPNSLPTSKPASKAGSRAGSRAPSRPLTPTSALDLSRLQATSHTQAAAAAQEDDLP